MEAEADMECVGRILCRNISANRPCKTVSNADPYLFGRAWLLSRQGNFECSAGAVRR
jgi:hypothetical protein